jgi:hypothetical protein
MDSSTLAAAFAIALAAYLLITDWVDLAPWNKVDDLPVRQKLLLSATNYTPLLFIAAAVLVGGGGLVVLALLVGLVDLAMHVAYWWLPYLRGASAEQLAERAQLFGGTTTFLPTIGNHPIPNAQHVVVGILMAAMVAFTAVSAI